MIKNELLTVRKSLICAFDAIRLEISVREMFEFDKRALLSKVEDFAADNFDSDRI